MQLFLIIFLIIAGCASPNEKRFYVPNPVKTKPTYFVAPPFEAVDDICIKSFQKKENKREMGVYRHKWEADLSKWTDCAVSFFSQILKERGATIDNRSSRSIKMAVTDVDVDWEFSEIRCSLMLKVRTGNNYEKSIHKTYFSRDLYDSCNGALISALDSLFKDENIVKYISKPKRKRSVPPKKKISMQLKRDSDHDGVLDDWDKCPGTPRRVKVDKSGCPLDNDKDGVPDYMDKCPDTPLYAEVDKKGCWTLKNILFDFDKWNIKAEYFPYLDRIAEIMKKNPYLKMELDGHTDIIGAERYNQKLSIKRARAVSDYLLKKGVSRDRIIIKGFSYRRPIAPSDTDSGRALNRRVEFIPVKE